IKRDLREWLVLLPIAFFFIFGLMGFLSSGGNLSEMRGYAEISWPIAQGLFLVGLAFTSGTAAASSIGREGSSLPILRVIPLSGKHIAIGKLWISWLIPLTLLTVLEIIIGVFLGWTLTQLALGILMKA